MNESEIRFRVALDSPSEAQAVTDTVQAHGGHTESTPEKGILPLAVLLLVVLPPGIALLAQVINSIAHSWIDRGVVIDARGTGAPVIRTDKALPHGTIVILTRDGQSAKRTDLPGVDTAAYIAAVLKGLAGGEGAKTAKAGADALLGAG
jgi:hypothetical protein